MDTIFALSTAPGKSGVAIVRVSGSHALGTLRALGVSSLPAPRIATLVELKVKGALLDKALALHFPAPHSFTGEDVLEYHIHGSRAVIKALLETLSTLPSLRPAEPGEFTRRAFLHEKMDLTAAEGLADLIDAETDAQRKQALRFMRGDAEMFYQALRQEVLEALALMEAYIDFPDEDIPEWVLSNAENNVRTLIARIEAELAGSGAAERVRDGVQVAILGAPNAGKSSLMNLLAKRDVAIVSETAGTTRDVIEVHMDIDGYAVVIADTAGLREAEGDIEREGIRRSLKRAEDADIRIVVLDAQAPNHEHIASFIDGNTIVLLNKTDLALPRTPLPVIEGITPIPFSTKTRAGIEVLMNALGSHVARLSSAQSSFIARERHRHHLQQALTHLKNRLAMPHAGLELQCEELRRAAVEIGDITGTVSVDEVLGQIFSRFCIGK